MIYIIGGVPRTGKTLLGERLSRELSASHIETDHIRAMFDADPRSPISYAHGARIERVTKALRPYLDQLISCLARTSNDYIINGEAVSPASVYESPYATHLRGCFLGISSPDVSFENIRLHASDSDWTREKSDHDLYRMLQKYATRSAITSAACADRGVPYFDVSYDFHGAHNSAYMYLASGHLGHHDDMPPVAA